MSTTLKHQMVSVDNEKDVYSSTPAAWQCVNTVQSAAQLSRTQTVSHQTLHMSRAEREMISAALADRFG